MGCNRDTSFEEIEAVILETLDELKLSIKSVKVLCSIDSPSETVFKYTEAYSVSEPAAYLYSGAHTLLLNKKKSGNETISVARISFE